MPDTADTGAVTLPDIQIPEGASTESVFASFAQLDPQRFPQHAKASEKPAEAVPNSIPNEEKPEGDKGNDKSSVPEQFLGKKETEVDEWEQIVAEEPKGPLKHENYKKVIQVSSKKIEALRAELAQREAKVAEYEKRGAIVPEEVAAKLKHVEDTLAEREALLERIAVQESPKFKEKFSSKEQAISQRLEKTAKEMGLDNELIQQALTSSLKRRTELMDNLDVSPTVRGQIDSLMVQYDLLQDDKGNFLNQSKEEAARWQAEQKETIARQEQERTAYEDRVFNETIDEMSKNFAPFQEVEGNEQWNSQVRAFREEARKYFNGQLDLKDIAKVVVKGVGAQALEQINTALHSKLENAYKEIASLKKAQPGASGNIPTPDGKVDDRHLSPQERARLTFQRLVGSAQNNGF